MTESCSVLVSLHLFTWKFSLQESLVWFKVADSGYTIDSGSPLGLLLDILLSCVLEILQLLDVQDLPLHVLHSADGRWSGCWGGATHSPGSGTG